MRRLPALFPNLPLRRTPAVRRAMTVVACILILHGALRLPGESLQGIRTVAIGPMGDGASALALRNRILDRLRNKGRIKVANHAASADAVLRGTSNIWATGTVVMDPRSNSSRQSNYQGYLSLELVNKDNQLLWSYLVTPGRFRLGSITDDLADHAVARLLEAIESGAAATASSSLAGAAADVALHAAGATLPAPLYLKWFESAGMRVTYDAIGSEAGIEQLAAGKIDFAASDMPLTPENAPPQLKVLEIPTVVGAVVPIYNLPGLGGDLFLTPEVLAGIYLGEI